MQEQPMSASVAVIAFASTSSRRSQPLPPTSPLPPISISISISPTPSLYNLQKQNRISSKSKKFPKLSILANKISIRNSFYGYNSDWSPKSSTSSKATILSSKQAWKMLRHQFHQTKRTRLVNTSSETHTHSAYEA